MSDPQDERRAFPRTGMSLLVKFFPIPDDRNSPDSPIPGLTDELSRFGMSAWVGREIPDGTRCIVRFFNTESKVSPDMVWGVVKRSAGSDDGFVIGFEFERSLEFVDAPGMEAGQAGAAELDLGFELEHPYRVLVVEDQERVRDLLARFLTERGFEVETAADGEQGLRKAEGLRPDLLLLDLYLPKMSGLELLREIRARECDVGVVCAISGYASEEEAKEIFRLGAADYFPKPLDLGYLAWSLRVRLEAAGAPRRPA